MNILLCPDKFKGSLSAPEVCRAIEDAINETLPHATVKSIPLADGGEGTCDLLTEWFKGTSVEVRVHGPLFDPVNARYGLSSDGRIAFIEMASASGLMLLAPVQRNPLFTTTFGTGELIADALNRGVDRIILGIGGSATNDAGIGMAAALGYSFESASGELLKPTGENLIHVHTIKADRIHPRLEKVEFIALCDVKNALYGPNGAAHVYAAQKGADKRAIELLDDGLRNFRRVVHERFHVPVDFPGAGAAGGLGAGARVFLKATIQRGISYLIETSGLDKEIDQADIVITGEGKVDQQTFSGKVVSEIIALTSHKSIPVLVVCGVSEIPRHEARAKGVQDIITLVDDETPPDLAMSNAANILKLKVQRLFSDVR